MRDDIAISLTAFLFIIPASRAAPTIVSVSGTILDGKTLTITTTGAGSKTTAKPALWDDYENGDGTPSSLGVKSSYDGSGGISTSTTGCYAGSFCAASTAGWLNSATGMHLDVALGFGRSDKFYFNIKDYSTQITYYDPNDGSHNTKGPFRMWTGSNGTTPDLIMGGAQIDGSTSIDAESAAPQTTGVNRVYPPGSLTTPPQGVWRTVEIIGQYSSATGAQDGYLELRINGVVEGTTTFQFDTSGTPGVSNYLVMEWVTANNSQGQWVNIGNHRFDNVYLDTGTWQHVVLTNASTIAASTIIEPQIPSSWGDTSITVKENFGTLTGGSKYLYVCDASNACSPGFDVGLTNKPTGCPCK